MGSAAPSPRRWTAVLALGVGACLVALAAFLLPGLGGGPAIDGADEADRGPRPGLVAVVGGVAETVTVTVQLEPGWRVPDRVEAGGADGTLPGVRRPGDDTVGVGVDVADGSATFVVRSPVARDLAVRVATPDGPGTWRALPLGFHEAPDGLPGEEGSDDAPPAAIPVLLPEGATRIEFIDRGGVDRAFDVIFLPRFDAPTEAGFDADFDGPAGPAAAPPGAPDILPRSAWTTAGWATGNGSCGEGPAVSDHLQAIVIHHTVTTNEYGPDQVDDILRSIHYTHTEINGWCDVGYNFVVDRFGRIWEARTGSIGASVIGGHARGFNNNTLGVALLGQHHQGAWPPAATASTATQDAVQALADWKLGSEGVDPHGRTWLRNRSDAARQRLAGETWHHVPTVLGHRDVGLTSCPGSNGMILVGALPNRLAAGIDTTPPYEWAGWRPHSHGPALAVADARGGVRPAGSAEPWSPAPGGLAGSGGVVAVGGGLGGGYLLAGTGALSPYGSAPAVGSPVPAGGAVDLVVRGDGRSGWVLDGTGVLRGFGGSPDLRPDSAVVDPVAAALGDDGRGYVLERSGRLVPVGGLAGVRVAPGAGTSAVDLDLDGPASGWVLDGSGRLLGFGGRPDRRVAADATPVAVAAGLNEPGGWVLDANGQLWPFGGARYVIPVSTTTRTADAVDVSGVGLVYDADFLAGADARYLDRLHRVFIGRPATEAEIDRGVASLEQGADAIDLTTALARSEQWAGSALDRMYREVLGREPDPEGRAYWMGEIAAGLRLQELGTYFYGSREYARAAGSDQAYVRRLYEVLLRRAPDGEGLAYWTGELASGRAQPPDIASGFYVSIESRRERSTRLHQQIMGSTPSNDRRDALADRLSAIGDVGLAAELAAGPDFYRLATDGPAP
jgi:hypothetical protein